MTLVLANGVFDVLHAGHVEHLQQARAMGDSLIVLVTADRHVHKGPGRPVNTDIDRARVLRALSCVDGVIINQYPSAVAAIAELRPDIYVKGPDYARGEDHAGQLGEERQALEAAGGKLVFTTGREMHSTDIIRVAQKRVSADAEAWLLEFRRRHSVGGISLWLNRAKTLRVDVVGEQITDQYFYVEPHGRSAKEAIVTWTVTAQQEMAGGIDAVAGHLRAVSDHPVTILSTGGKVRKTRYVQRPFLHKVFSLAAEEGEPVGRGKISVGVGDMLVVADFGHGLIGNSAAAASLIHIWGGYVALTVQANSLNWGLNTLAKWPSADYIVLDEAEMRLALQDNARPVEALIAEVHTRWKAKMVAITLGHRGCLVHDGRETYAIPALATTVIDRMGAGDAFLAITAPLAYIGAPPEVIGFMGNVAGAIKVGIVGNSRAIERKELHEWVDRLLG